MTTLADIDRMIAAGECNSVLLSTSTRTDGHRFVVIYTGRNAKHLQGDGRTLEEAMRNAIGKPKDDLEGLLG